MLWISIDDWKVVEDLPHEHGYNVVDSGFVGQFEVQLEKIVFGVWCVLGWFWILLFLFWWYLRLLTGCNDWPWGCPEWKYLKQKRLVCCWWLLKIGWMLRDCGAVIMGSDSSDLNFLLEDAVREEKWWKVFSELCWSTASFGDDAPNFDVWTYIFSGYNIVWDLSGDVGADNRSTKPPKLISV